MTYFLLHNIENVLKNVCNQIVLVNIAFDCVDQKNKKNDILQNILQRKESLTGLEQHEGL